MPLLAFMPSQSRSSSSNPIPLRNLTLPNDNNNGTMENTITKQRQRWWSNGTNDDRDGDSNRTGGWINWGRKWKGKGKGVDDGEGTSIGRNSSLWRFDMAFFIFGLLNNVLYVIILTAALDLLGSNEVPKGVVLFANITPALLAKVAWPYLVSGKVRYSRRISSCSTMSFLGIVIISLSTTLPPRIIGICLASFSSGMGEMTFLQLSTRYNGRGLKGGESEDDNDNDNTEGGGEGWGGRAVGWFSSGTGGAGLVGAGLWWLLRGLGIREGLGVCSVLPICMSLSYFLLLPLPVSLPLPSSTNGGTIPKAGYEPVATFAIDDEDEPEEDGEGNKPARESRRDGQRLESMRGREESQAGVEIEQDQSLVVEPLGFQAKIRLARELVLPYMVPLFLVYLAEYTVNTACSSNFIYLVPDPEKSPIWGRLIKALQDWYVFWQLDYQTFVFISRSSLSLFRLPAIPKRWLPLPTAIQCCILLVGVAESLWGWVGEGDDGHAPPRLWLLAILVAMEGLCGGGMYVGVYYWVGREGDDDSVLNESQEGQVRLEEGEGQDEASLKEGRKDWKRREMESEFRMACVGFADTFGIVTASLLSGLLEPALCRAQINRGKPLCRQI